MLLLLSGIFPEAEKDPVIQIASMVIQQGEKEPFVRNVFTLQKCAPIVGAEVKSFAREGEMLKVMLCATFSKVKYGVTIRYMYIEIPSYNAM